MNTDFNECLERHSLVKWRAGEDMVKKELATAEGDLERAKKTAAEKDFKWATVQAYYSMFHAAKALVYRAGFREKSHYCLFVALKTLYVDTNRLEPRLAEMFSTAMKLREDADYGMIYSEESALRLIKGAEELLQKAKEILG